MLRGKCVASTVHDTQTGSITRTECSTQSCVVLKSAKKVCVRAVVLEDVCILSVCWIIICRQVVS